VSWLYAFWVVVWIIVGGSIFTAWVAGCFWLLEKAPGPRWLRGVGAATLAVVGLTTIAWAATNYVISKEA